MRFITVGEVRVDSPRSRADTVIVVVAMSVSLTAAGSTDRSTSVGVSSSSSMVMSASATVRPPEWVPSMRTISPSPSSRVSWIGSRLTVAVADLVSAGRVIVASVPGSS